MPVGLLAHGKDVRRHVLSTTPFEHANHPVCVQGERAERVDDDQVSSGEGVDEAAGIALTQDVEDTGLVEVSELNDVLHLVLGRRVGLQREEERREGEEGEEGREKRGGPSRVVYKGRVLHTYTHVHRRCSNIELSVMSQI